MLIDAAVFSWISSGLRTEEPDPSWQTFARSEHAVKEDVRARRKRRERKLLEGVLLAALPGRVEEPVYGREQRLLLRHYLLLATVDADEKTRNQLCSTWIPYLDPHLSNLGFCFNTRYPESDMTLRLKFPLT
jgi:hypothetical protein